MSVLITKSNMNDTYNTACAVADHLASIGEWVPGETDLIIEDPDKAFNVIHRGGTLVRNLDYTERIPCAECGQYIRTNTDYWHNARVAACHRHTCGLEGVALTPDEHHALALDEEERAAMVAAARQFRQRMP